MTSERAAGTPQGLALMVMPIFAMLGAVLMAPILPKLQDHFAGTPHATTLVPLLLTAPALSVGLLAPAAGALADRVGPRRMLLWALAVYGLAGTAPMYLQSLYAIFVTRLLVGVAEAAIVTGSVALLAAYFNGDRRQKWFAYQNGFLTTAGAIIIFATGAVGDLSWRATFAAYLLSILMLAFAWPNLFEVSPRMIRPPGLRVPPWRDIIIIVAIAVPGSIAYYISPVEIAYVLRERGHHSVATAGGVTALAVSCGLVGAIASRFLTLLTTGQVLAIATAAMGCGLLVMGAGRNLELITLGMALHQAGGALMLTSGLTYTAGRAKPDDRGVYSGTWFFFYMIAQFLTPLLLAPIFSVTHTHVRAVLAAGVLTLAGGSWLLKSKALQQPLISVLASPKRGVKAT